MRNSEKGCANVSIGVAEIKWPSVLGLPKIGSMCIGAGSTFYTLYREPCANAQATKKMNAVVWSVSVLYLRYVGSEMVMCILREILPHFGKLLSTHFGTAMDSYVRILLERILFTCSSNNYFLKLTIHSKLVLNNIQ